MDTPRRLLSFLAFLFFVLYILGHEVRPTAAAAQPKTTPAEVQVGLIVDLETMSGRKSLTSIRMAVEDFYAAHPNYTTRIVPRVLDSKQNAVDAAAAAVDLMKNSKVAAIIGPATSSEAEFIVILGNATQTPIISYSASSPSLSVISTPYFIRATLTDVYQSPLIAALIKYYGWHSVVPIYEDSVYGSGILPSLINALQFVDVRVPYRSSIPPSASDDRITAELYRLKTLPSRIFVIHMMPSLASRLFRLASAAGMMAEGYAWIVTDGITGDVDIAGVLYIDAMQGVIGMRPHLRSSPELKPFVGRWRARFRRENPDDHSTVEPSVFQLWAYDAAQAVASAVERAFPGSDFQWQGRGSSNSTDMTELGVFVGGPPLLAALQSTRFHGISGEFQLDGGELKPPPFEIVNFVGKGGRTVGFWTQDNGISSKLGSPEDASATPAKRKVVIWPGESTIVPKGWEIPTGGRKLQIAVPVKNGFNQFVNVQHDPKTNATVTTGYCIDIFDAVMATIPYSVSYEYIPFEDSAASYNVLVNQVYYKNFDAVVGDTTILANRSEYVDFTLPYTDSGVALVVPLRQDNTRNAWIFLKPLTTDLWLGGLSFFFFTGLVVWAIEHRINPEFRGRPSHQMGTTLYFVFSTLIFSHKEKLESNLSRLVVVIWVFVVLILTSSYTASLTSMLTVQKLQPAADNIGQLLQRKARVGYQDGSFVLGMLQRMGFRKDQLKSYSTPEQYKDAMLSGSGAGGVDAIFDEIPYLKLFLSEYCADFSMVGKTYKTAGFGFVFPRGSPLVQDVSRAILNVTEGDMMMNIERKWFGDQRTCPARSNGVSSSSLNFWNFGGLFMITGTVSLLALVIYIVIFFWKEREALAVSAVDDEDRGGSIWDKAAAWARYYDSFKEEGSDTGRRKRDEELNWKEEVNPESMQSPLSISDMWGVNLGLPERDISGRTSSAERSPEVMAIEMCEARRES